MTLMGSIHSDSGERSESSWVNTEQGIEADSLPGHVPKACSVKTRRVVMNSTHRKGIVAAGLAALCWGTATVMSKVALDGVSPVALLVAQLAASVVLLWLVVFLWRIPSGSRREIAKFAFLGLLEPGLAYLLGLIGLTDMRAGSATLVQSSEAIMIVMVSAVLLRDKPTKQFLLLSVLAFAGLVFALGLFRPEDAVGNGVFGVTLMFLATATAAFYVVMSSRIAMQTHPVVIVAWQQTVALIFAVLLLPVEVLFFPQGALLPGSLQLWLFVILSGIIQYALAFSLYMYALGTVSANLAGTFLNLTPVFGLGIAYIFLEEKLSLMQLAGAAITITAVMLINRSSEASH